MKQISIFLASAVLLFAACNQSNTNPTTPSPPSCSTVNNVYVEISFNGKTLKSNAYEYQGLKLGSIAYIYPAQSVGDESQIAISSVYICPTGNLLGNLQISLGMWKLGSPTAGTYTNNTVSVGTIGDWSSGTMKSYTIKDSSLIANVSSISSDYITGTFTCTVKDATTEYPATGSFNVLRNN